MQNFIILIFISIFFIKINVIFLFILVQLKKFIKVDYILFIFFCYNFLIIFFLK